jgi:hypothetical protein
MYDGAITTTRRARKLRAASRSMLGAYRAAPPSPIWGAWLGSVQLICHFRTNLGEPMKRFDCSMGNSRLKV